MSSFCMHTCIIFLYSFIFFSYIHTRKVDIFDIDIVNLLIISELSYVDLENLLTFLCRVSTFCIKKEDSAKNPLFYN